jgi:O-acetyl-ADP-ribose deacetylase (regulator of RNase III)
MIHYIKGDATQPQGEGKKIICHICNDIGAWGAGFVLAISRRWSAPEEEYRKLKTRHLGDVQIVHVTDDISVANMIAQRGIGDTRVTGILDKDIKPPIVYGAVRIALNKVNDIAHYSNATLHMPRIGCGLAGGRWEEIEKIINGVASVDVYVYDLK